MFWNVPPFAVIEMEKCFGGTYCLYHQGKIRI
jgi:hypothetical protein